MAKVTIDSGICGFTTTLTTACEDGQTVEVAIETDCPNLEKVGPTLGPYDAYTEMFQKPHESEVYRTLSNHLPHISCPIYCGFFKAIEVGASLALPKDAHLTIEQT